MSRSMVDRIAIVIREQGWSCDMPEPVTKWGQCSDCDHSHRDTARAILDALRGES